MNDDLRPREPNTHNHHQSCYFHPHHSVTIGVCPFCLTERLDVIAAKQRREESTAATTRRDNGRRKQNHKHPSQESQPPRNYNSFPNKSKIFALGPLLNLLELRRSRKCPRERPDSDGDYAFRSACDDDLDDQYYTSSSLEDSFISIKFGDDGVPSWDKNKSEVLGMSKKGVSDQVQISSSKLEAGNRKGVLVVEQTKLPQQQNGWQNRVRELLQLIRLRRRSLNKGAVPCNAVDGKKKKKNRGWWIRRALSRRRSKD